MASDESEGATGRLARLGAVGGRKGCEERCWEGRRNLHGGVCTGGPLTYEEAPRRHGRRKGCEEHMLGRGAGGAGGGPIAEDQPLRILASGHGGGFPHPPPGPRSGPRLAGLPGRGGGTEGRRWAGGWRVMRAGRASGAGRLGLRRSGGGAARGGEPHLAGASPPARGHLASRRAARPACQAGDIHRGWGQVAGPRAPTGRQ
jgi:hypothetical protein